MVPALATAQLELPTIFSDHMVLQRDRPVKVWGLTEAGRTVEVRFGERSARVKAGPDGAWEAELEPMSASFRPGVLVVDDGRERREFRDVLVGEVWLCGGQSNMQWTVRQSKDADFEIPTARYPAMRLHQVDRVASESPRFSANAAWVPCSPETVGDFSAVGFFFGRDIHHILQVPVGLVDASRGGTPAIAWTRESAFSRHPLLSQKAEDWDNWVAEYPGRVAAWEEELKTWMETRALEVDREDFAISEHAADWHKAVLNDFTWDEASLPTTFGELLGEEVDGAVWFRRRIELPVAMRGRNLTLSLGRIADFDQTWVNGDLIGETGPGIENPAGKFRRYTLPARLTRMGELTLAVRVFDRVEAGGFLSPAKAMLLVGEASAARLAGDGWRYRVEKTLDNVVGDWDPARHPDAPRKPSEPRESHRPGSLANGMLAPVVPYALRGAIWYQGESDTGWEPERYGERLRVMIEDWREWWGIDDLHVGVVQLAGFTRAREEPSDEAWPKLRESQRGLVRDLPHSGLVVAADLGEANDIHPVNKQEVGRRLARWALADVYDELELRGGPEAAGASFEQDRVVVSFHQAGSGLHVIDGLKPDGFTLAGRDGVFYPAEAVIEADSVIVTSDKVPAPEHVRYGWQNNPAHANLGNRERLPAGPFEFRKD